MKNITSYIFLLLTMPFWGCIKETYPGATVSPYISIYDVRELYKGNDLTLTTNSMYGSTRISGMVVSDHSGGNLPAGLLVLQDARRLSSLRGISVALGDAANQYKPGDSVIIDVQGGILKRVNGILEVTNVSPSAVTKVSSGNSIPVNRVASNLIVANPNNYESTLAVIVKGGFDPLPTPKDRLVGDKLLNDGFADITLHTEDSATFATDSAPVLANFYGIVFNTVGKGDSLIPELRMRTGNDVVVLSSTISVAPVIITGFASDVKGADTPNEYIQLMATQDIDFSVTPFALVTINNANASTPTGYPAKGWATGGMRTFKFNLFSGTAKKGTFFYVGGSSKLINGALSTDISSSNWIRSFDYTIEGGDGFGNALPGGLLANSGNAFGMAVFSDSVVTATSVPVDCIFISSGGSLYTAGPPAAGYLIANTDFYDIKNPITLVDQPYYRAGSNTLCFAYNTADVGYFNMLGGSYSPTLGRWMKARAQNNITMSKTSPISLIEGTGATTLQ